MSTTYKRKDTAELILNQIKEIIQKNGGIVKREQIRNLGIDYRRVLSYVEEGSLVRIKNGYYTDALDRFSEEELITKLYPDAKLCMESALYLYGYIAEKPFGWHLAVNKNTSKSRFKMDYPKVIPYYTEPKVLQLGTTEITYKDWTFGIYDRDRLICDCLKYENKMDRSTFKEALQSYIKDDKKDISALLMYAEERKVRKRVQSLIGVWL